MAKKPAQGFFKADGRNLPAVDTFMWAEFYKTLTSSADPEVQNVRLRRATRKAYVEAAVGYVQVQREQEKCTVKAEVTPEHRVRYKGYSVTCVVDEKEAVVIDSKCHDCVASEGYCKHAVALVVWLHLRTVEPSPTEEPAYWKKPRLGSVCDTILKASSIVKPKIFNIRPDTVEFFKEYSLNDMEATAGSANLSLYSQEQSSIAMFHLMLGYKSSQDCVREPISFLDHCNNMMTPAACSSVLKETEEQSSSSLWHQLRCGRITASTLFDVSRCTTADGCTVNTIIGNRSIKETNAMERGRRLEPEVLKYVSNKYGKVNKCGLVLNRRFPHFGASPDGVLRDHIVEVKCPMSEKTVDSYFTNNHNEPADRYMCQVQLQMLFCGKPRGLFCVADPQFEVNREVTILNVDFNEPFLLSAMRRASTFWNEYIFPQLFDKV